MWRSVRSRRRHNDRCPMVESTAVDDEASPYTLKHTTLTPEAHRLLETPQRSQHTETSFIHLPSERPSVFLLTLR